MPFSNPIVGGTALVRPAIKSPNYVAGVSGWSINRDGTAEFGSAILRGSLQLGASSGPNITFTQTIPAVLTTFYAGNTIYGGRFSNIGGGGAYAYELWMANNLGLGELKIVTGFVDGSGNVFEMFSQEWDQGIAGSNKRFVTFGDILGPRTDGMQYFFNGVNAANGGNLANLTGYSKLVIDTFVDLFIGARSQGRGLVDRATSAANIAVTGGAVRFLACPGATYHNGRAFVAHLNAIWNASAAGITATLTALNGGGTGISGTTRTPGLPVVASQAGFDFWLPFRNNSGADVTTGMQMQGVASAGTVNLAGSAAYPATLDIYDVGAAGDYPDYPTM